MTTVASEIAERAAVDPRVEWLDSLRQIADWLAEHPEVPQPYHLIGSELYIYLHGGDSRTKLAAIARAFGNADKRVDGSRFGVARRFGAITLIASAAREEVCERVVIGTREVTEDKPDPAAVAALPKVPVTTVVEDVRWVCPPSLLAAADSEPTVEVTS